MNNKLIIALDGYSSCGKSTFAKAIAERLKYIYIDSGAMYRAVTLYCMRKGYINNKGINTNSIINNLNDIIVSFSFNNNSKKSETLLNSENVENEIRGIEVSEFVSRVSQIYEVRTRMVELQRKVGINKGIVMDGRDIGTVVFPEADLKIFMTATVDIRAKRRFDELFGKGDKVDIDEIRRNIVARDIADENRDISPLRRADDAEILDNSRMTVDEQMEWVMKLIEKRHAG